MKRKAEKAEKVQPVQCVCGSPPCNRAEPGPEAAELPESREVQRKLLHGMAPERGGGGGSVEYADRCRRPEEQITRGDQAT